MLGLHDLGGWDDGAEPGPPFAAMLSQLARIVELDADREAVAAIAAHPAALAGMPGDGVESGQLRDAAVAPDDQMSGGLGGRIGEPADR